MGLLDDAIREHLELKRLRGADPSEVAREEHAALGPREPDDDGPDFDVAEPADEADGYDKEARTVDGADQTGPDADRSTGTGMPRSSEETMEVDMRTLIDADLGHDDGDLGLSGEAMVANTHAAGSGWAGDSDWEPREQRRRSGRPMRALGLAGGPSIEGSLP